MSTRAHILITDRNEREDKNGILFYRHSDGYPEGVKESLTNFLSYVEKNIIRDNAQQSAGWLILIGHEEYHQFGSKYPPDENNKSFGWKVGAYEPVVRIHIDIDWFYIVDVGHKTITAFEYNGETAVAEFFDRKDGVVIN